MGFPKIKNFLPVSYQKPSYYFRLSDDNLNRFESYRYLPSAMFFIEVCCQDGLGIINQLIEQYYNIIIQAGPQLKQTVGSQIYKYKSNMDQIFNDPIISHFLKSIKQNEKSTALKELVLLGINSVSSLVHHNASTTGCCCNKGTKISSNEAKNCDCRCSYVPNIMRVHNTPGVFKDTPEFINQLQRMKNKIQSLQSVINNGATRNSHNFKQTQYLYPETAHFRNDRLNSQQQKQNINRDDNQGNLTKKQFRHHLDDSQVRKALFNPYAKISPIKKQKKAQIDQKHLKQKQQDQKQLRKNKMRNEHNHLEEINNENIEYYKNSEVVDGSRNKNTSKSISKNTSKIRENTKKIKNQETREEHNDEELNQREQEYNQDGINGNFKKSNKNITNNQKKFYNKKIIQNKVQIDNQKLNQNHQQYNDQEQEEDSEYNLNHMNKVETKQNQKIKQRQKDHKQDKNNKAGNMLKKQNKDSAFFQDKKMQTINSSASKMKKTIQNQRQRIKSLSSQTKNVRSIIKPLIDQDKDKKAKAKKNLGIFQYSQQQEFLQDSSLEEELKQIQQGPCPVHTHQDQSSFSQYSSYSVDQVEQAEIYQQRNSKQYRQAATFSKKQREVKVRNRNQKQSSGPYFESFAANKNQFKQEYKQTRKKMKEQNREQYQISKNKRNRNQQNIMYNEEQDDNQDNVSASSSFSRFSMNSKRQAGKISGIKR